MKKIILGSLVASSLLMADVAVEQAQLKEEIAAAKSEVKAAQTKVKKLQAQLPPNEKLVTHTELGYIKTDGNTNTKAFILEASAKKAFGANVVGVALSGQCAKNNDIESKKKYSAKLNYGYMMTDRFSLTLLAMYKKDKFSGFNSQSSAGFGAKYIAYKSSTQKLSLEGNILYSMDDIEDIHYDAGAKVISYPNASNTPISTTTDGDEHNYGAYRASLAYTLQILPNLKFTQGIDYKAELEESQNYFVLSKTAFISKISDIFSAGVSYKVDYANTPPASKDDTDSTFSLNLIIDY